MLLIECLDLPHQLTNNVPDVQIPWLPRTNVANATDVIIITNSNGESKIIAVSNLVLPVAVVDLDRANVVFGTNAVEIANTITVPLFVRTLGDLIYLTDLVDILLVVSDAANDREPSPSSTLSIGSKGTMFAGNGTATGQFRFTNMGELEIIVSETNVGFRYLWVVAGGNTRLFAKSRDGVHELQFT